MRTERSSRFEEPTSPQQERVIKPLRALSFSSWRRHAPVRKVDRDDVILSLNEGVDLATSPGGKPPIKFLSFCLIVLIPFFAFLCYFVFGASDQYTAEARFAVRSIAEHDSKDNTDSDVLSMSSAGQDAFVVTSFIHSHEILERIGKKIDYRSMFARPDIDSFSRFDKQGSTEEFAKYWQRQVTAYIDGPSGIVTLKVRAFHPDDARLLTQAILDESEQLINELNVRAQRDLISSISGEVERTGKRYSDSLAALNRFQQSAGLLSPQAQATETGKLLTGLLGDRLKLETRLSILKTSAADKSPAYDQLVRARDSLAKQIEALRAELTGPENASIANAILSFSRLETDKLVAEKLYEASRNNYDSALAASLRKALYIMVFVHPTIPQESLYPKRVSTPLFIGLALVVAWATLMLLWASIEDHKL
ncbi:MULTISPECIES: capsule biosynthesis protein [unclassified Ensifer]|uniref:capsule biosynthesis protein n=1 Tax=unclassified Ensifer TaxID=2633371 RepID=UPI00081363B3|nr:MULTISPECIES: capsule biosynthesis protein [unclassified Ensifer]OCP18537.1 capsule biosynthesis protein [Ensifer sp. LC54]OCP18674.1 capsule biosynthesis protein [Ensifer sp. LC384]